MATPQISSVTETVDGFTGQVQLPKLIYPDGGIIKFSGHHVIPEDVLEEFGDFFRAIGFDGKDFAQNGLPLPTINISHYTGSEVQYILSRTEVVDRLGMPLHNGGHPPYSNAIESIIAKFDADLLASNFGGLTRARWLANAKTQINGMVGLEGEGVPRPRAPLRRHRQVRQAGEGAVMLPVIILLSWGASYRT
jgi:hypothetical protein